MMMEPMSGDSTIKGTSVRPRSRRPKQFASGRVCAAEGCETRISRYNAREFCHLHAPKKYPRVRGRWVASPDG
jgi:hypothetical protein